MIRIEDSAWKVMLEHAIRAYPGECWRHPAWPGRQGGQRTRFRSPFRAAMRIRAISRTVFSSIPVTRSRPTAAPAVRALTFWGFFHSHPDHGLYFSETDLKNSWPWYSNIVLSIRKGEFSEAGAFRADEAQTLATREELVHPRE